jgi:hypothetical protein
LSEVIPNKSPRILYIMPCVCPSNTRTVGIISGMINLFGGTLAKVPPLFDLLHQSPAWGSNLWIILQICRILGNASYFVAGVMAMYLNQCWKKNQRRKLAFWISWWNGLGGLIFFVSGFGCILPMDVVQSTLYPLGYLIGSVLYLGGSIGALVMWKLNQFGYVYAPSLNRYNKRDRLAAKKRKNILYRDIAFIGLYNISAALAVMAIAFSFQCHRYSDWIKNQLHVLLGSFTVLLLGSVMHAEPLKRPYTYLLWFLRFYIVLLTASLAVDTYHLSSERCFSYGNHGFPQSSLVKSP